MPNPKRILSALTARVSEKKTGNRCDGFLDSDDDELDLSPHRLFTLENARIAKGANYARSATNRASHVLEDGADHWSEPRRCGARRATRHGLRAGTDVAVHDTWRRRAEPQ